MGGRSSTTHDLPKMPAGKVSQPVVIDGKTMSRIEALEYLARGMPAEPMKDSAYGFACANYRDEWWPNPPPCRFDDLPERERETRLRRAQDCLDAMRASVDDNLFTIGD